MIFPCSACNGVFIEINFAKPVKAESRFCAEMICVKVCICTQELVTGALRRITVIIALHITVRFG